MVMGKVMLQILVVISILSVIIQKDRELPLYQLVQFAEQEEITIEYGELLIKETFSITELDAIRSFIVQSDFSRVSSNLENYQRELLDDTYEQISLIESKPNQEITVSYLLSGDVVKLLQDQQFVNQIEQFIGLFYTNKKLEYACIRSSKSDNINSGYFFNEILSDLRVDVHDRLVETDFVVVSGFSDQFSHKIPVGNQMQNIQIAVRTYETGESILTLGTPILTTEY